MTQSSGALSVKLGDGRSAESDLRKKAVFVGSVRTRFVFKKKVLPRDGKLSDHGIKPKDEIEMKSRDDNKEESVEIYVRLSNGKNVPFDVQLSCNSILHVKNLIAEEEGIPQEQQNLEFEDQPLDDWNTLSDYNIQEGSVLRLAARLRGGKPVTFAAPDVKQQSFEKTGKNNLQFYFVKPGLNYA
ncbi:Ubiquitin family protein, partial [Reticulomyxa filosa]